MFIISNETGIVYKNAESYLFRITDDGFSYALPDHSFDKLKEEFGSAKDLTQKGRVVKLQGSFTYSYKNAYGQTLFEGETSPEDKAAAIAIGTFIDLSDSDFVLINCKEADFWKTAVSILDARMEELSGFFHRKERKELEPLVEYARTKARQ